MKLRIIAALAVLCAMLSIIISISGFTVAVASNSQTGNEAESLYYTVKRGDTLAKIAASELGDADRWAEIATLNSSVDPKRMTIGTRLKLPAKSAQPQSHYAPKVGNSNDPLFDIIIKADPELNQKAPIVEDTEDFGFLDAILPTRVLPTEAHKTKQVQATVTPKIDDPLKSKFQHLEIDFPENLKPDLANPYFVSSRGLHGFFNTESALLPNIRTLSLGFQLRYDKYAETDYSNIKLTGSQWKLPFNILFLRNRLMVGATLPAHSWEVKRNDATSGSVSMSGLHDPSVRVGYQIWRDYNYNQAITLHFEGRFPSGNYHQPRVDMTDKTRTGIVVGPSEATRGGWLQLGGAYSRQLSDRWNYHFNLSLASNPRDKMTRITPTSTLEYRMDESFVLVTELDAPSWSLNDGPDGTNINALLGLIWYTNRWQFSLGVPVNLQHNWGYKNSTGVQFGLSYRQD